MWTYNYSNYNPDVLCHHGVKGMKWGVRHDKKSTVSKKKRSKQEDWSEEAKEANLIKKKRVNQMTNSELRKLNERQNLERQHQQLNPSAISKGMKYVTTAAAVTGTALTIYANSEKIIKLGKPIVEAAIKNAKTIRV